MMIKENAIKNIESYETEVKNKYNKSKIINSDKAKICWVNHSVLDTYRIISPKNKTLERPILARRWSAMKLASMDTRTCVDSINNIYKYSFNNSWELYFDEDEEIIYNYYTDTSRKTFNNIIVDIKYIRNEGGFYANKTHLKSYMKSCKKLGLNEDRTNFSLSLSERLKLN